MVLKYHERKEPLAAIRGALDAERAETELTQALQACFAARGRDEVVAELEPLGVPIAPALSPAAPR